MAKRRHTLHPDAPLFHNDHGRPTSRRDFLRQSFITGTGAVTGGALLGLLGNPRLAQAVLSQDIKDMAGVAGCPIGGSGSGAKPIPFICFDLAGGANMVGSNVLVGGRGGHINDPVSTSGYSKMGIPGDMVPGGVETNPPLNGPNADTITSNGDFTDTTLGLPFHSDSAYLRGILNKLDLGNAAMVNGAVIPARSDNDTANNPHNPMYGIAKVGINKIGGVGDTGDITSLIGSRNSESGGNSVSPTLLIDPTLRPTKVDRPSDVTGLVDTGDLTSVLTNSNDVRAVMEAAVRISDSKINRVNTMLADDVAVRNLARCGYFKAADLTDRFVGVNIDPALDGDIVDRVDPANSNTGIFTQAEFDGDGEFRKTASVMKMVVDGHAGAGTIQMGGFDYHTSDRSTGEVRDLRAGKCIGACLEYAARRGTAIMIYVFSDGSLASNGTLDNSTDGRGKGVWTGDNSSTAASFFLVYNPGGAPTPLAGGTGGVQIGWFRPDGSVETNATPAANNVNLLVQTVLLNYLALHGDQGSYARLFGNDLGNAALMDSLTAFGKLPA